MRFVELVMPQRRKKILNFHGVTAWAADERGGHRVLRGRLRGRVVVGVGSASVSCVHSAPAPGARFRAERLTGCVGRGGW